MTRHHKDTHYLLAGEAILPAMPNQKMRVLLVVAKDTTENVAKKTVKAGQ